MYVLFFLAAETRSTFCTGSSVPFVHQQRLGVPRKLSLNLNQIIVLAASTLCFEGLYVCQDKSQPAKKDIKLLAIILPIAKALPSDLPKPIFEIAGFHRAHNQTSSHEASVLSITLISK